MRQKEPPHPIGRMDTLRPLWIRAAQKVADWTSPQGTVKNYFIYYQPLPYVHRETSSPLHRYTIPSAHSAADFAQVCGAEVGDNASRRAALDLALRDFFWVRSQPAVREREVVLIAPGWTGHYTVTENTEPTVLTIHVTPGSPLA
jgi:hypothetical protein